MYFLSLSASQEIKQETHKNIDRKKNFESLIKILKRLENIEENECFFDFGMNLWSSWSTKKW